MTHVQRILDATPATDLADHLRRGGGNGLDVARHTTPMSLISLVEQSGLRGRGGAGFPTGKKWRTVIAAASGSPIPVIVNAAERPGTFKTGLVAVEPVPVWKGHEELPMQRAARGNRCDQSRSSRDQALPSKATRCWRRLAPETVRIVEGPPPTFGEEMHSSRS